MKKEVACPSPDHTLAVGEAIGRALGPGGVIALEGPLGAGKTLLTKGIARGLGVREWRYVTSPTFAIHNVYQGRLRLHHLDLYRLGGALELEQLGLEEALHGADACVIEWPDILLQELPQERVDVRFRWGEDGGRILEIEAGGPVGETLSVELEAVVQDSGVRKEGV
ncbi:MAG: tRNA (adenosine(37)-N6)-threonylcarbamoyltransferase complex ATPase subunit type 1 TsaE [Deferrisomatales bacterium]|nr:tRNA (adenosine(37)-N6)-threonylcarbamoyltransferase complex ATPase subunit type 1 TsaE [Deferrisomatales bacterium]